MGRKGVNKRKPKTKSKPVSKAETNGPSKSPIQSLVKNNEDQIRKTEKGSKHLDDAMMFFVFNVHREKR
jgi:hypothetical protein